MEKTLIWQDEKALESGWLQVDICMRLAFSYYIWKKHFQPPYDESDECRFMRFAALQCSVLNLRALNEFFRPRISGTKETDIRASDYPRFINPGTFLSEPEMKQFNQLIAHLTYTRMFEFDTTWNVFLLLDKAYSYFKAFVDYIHDSHDFALVDPDTQATVQASKVNVQASIVIMKKRYEQWLSEMRAIEQGVVHVS